MDQQEYLDQAHEILHILLKEFDRVCRKYHVRYYLICGSLLGAVRHQGLIPWDDDVDVAMTRRDFNKAKKYFRKEWGSGKFRFVDYDELGKGVFLDFMTRLVYMEQEIPVNIYRKIRGKGRTDIDNHMPIDIYILDHASDNLKKHALQTKIIQGLYGLAMAHRSKIDYEEYRTESKTRQLQIRLLNLTGRFIPLKLIFWCYEKVRSMNQNKRCKAYFESNGWIYCIPWRFPKQWFGKGVRLTLDGLSVMCPADYDAFLSMHYGDYMALPPQDQRVPGHAEWASGVFQQ